MRPASRHISTRTVQALWLLWTGLFFKPAVAAGDELAMIVGTPSVLKPPTAIAIKKGVILQGLDARLYAALHQAGRIWLRHGQRLVVISGLDGRHKKGSLHDVGLAVDLRFHDFGSATRLQVTHELRRSLGDGFQVIGERDHIHVEYDP